MEEVPVSDAHSELHHYTDWKGLEGIVTTQSIWATHYQDLNDHSEIDHLKAHLIRGAAERLKRYLLKTEKTDRSIARMIHQKRQPIFKLSVNLAEATVDSLYEVTFRGFEGPPFAIPFIASFCAHSLDEQYEQENGLLSQWRGYGDGERYAVVFDSKSLEGLLTEESGAFQYLTSAFFDVIYDPDDEEYHELFCELEEQVRRISIEMSIKTDPDLGDIYRQFTLLASRLKHRSFSEEREVRIVANLQTQEMDDYLRTKAPNEYVRRTESFKDIVADESSGRRHIALFEKIGRLPIKRVIVGPHADKHEYAEKVRKLVGRRTTVHVSETPYVG